MDRPDRGSITGVVTDPANAAVANASIAAHNLGTGVDFRTSATNTGAYTLTSLPSGDYSVAVEHPGFKRFSRSQIRDGVVQTVRDIALQMGAASESITVTEDASMLQQDTSDYSMSMNGSA